MKAINYIYTILFGCLLAACNITEIPEDRVTPDTYFQTATDLEAWTNHYYSTFPTGEVLAGMNADDMVDKSMGSIIEGGRTPSDAMSGANEWNFSQLRKINYFFENAGICKDEQALAKYQGVSHFFRAHIYFEKVKRFGDMPYYDQVIGSGDEALLRKPRDNRGYVIDRVLEDLDQAIAKLPAEKDPVRVTKWTALALKSRVALFEGTWMKYHGLQARAEEPTHDANYYLNIAAAASEEFINNSGYKIYTSQSDSIPYRNLFISFPADLKTDEIILVRRYIEGTFMHSVQFSIRNNTSGFTRRFMNHYLTISGTPFTNITGHETMEFLDEVKDRDPRMAQTVLLPGYKKVGDTEETINDFTAVTGYEPIKYVVNDTYSGASKSFTDFPLFRAAEVYLNFAEAKAELGTLSQADLDKSVNKLRERVGMPTIQLASTTTADPYLLSCYPNVSKNNTAIILEIRRERTIELVMEGHRQWDMLRWKEGAQIVNDKNDYYGVYIPGPGKYDFNGDGVNDVEFYVKGTTPGKGLVATKLINSDVHLFEKGATTPGTSGYLTAFSKATLEVPYTWDETRDYLFPVPADQRVLTLGALTQNPGWDDGLKF